MQLTNTFGLLGVVILLQLADLLQLDFITAAAFLLLSGNAKESVNIVRTRLTPTNPMQTLTDKQFKKEFRFAKQDIPRLLHCLQWPQTLFGFFHRRHPKPPCPCIQWEAVYGREQSMWNISFLRLNGEPFLGALNIRPDQHGSVWWISFLISASNWNAHEDCGSSRSEPPNSANARTLQLLQIQQIPNCGKNFCNLNLSKIWNCRKLLQKS